MQKIKRHYKKPLDLNVLHCRNKFGILSICIVSTIGLFFEGLEKKRLRFSFRLLLERIVTISYN